MAHTAFTKLSTTKLSSVLMLAFVGLFSATIGVQPAISQVSDVQSQAELQSRIDVSDPSRPVFVKDRPILGWSIKTDQFDDIPKAIRMLLGDVDQTKYTQEYLAENIGSIVALQMNGEAPDFYIIGKSVFDAKYEVVDVENVISKNRKLVSRLDNVPEVLELLEQRDSSLVGALKSVPVEMITFSDIGYETVDQVIIQSPWGEQTKPANQEGFLVFDSSENQYYMVNQGEDGNPIGYIPAR